jgi:hypothetical protein
MVSLGNFYHNAHRIAGKPHEKVFGESKNKKDKGKDAERDWLHDSMKFYYSVLSDEGSKNVYAANGLGMICAEKGLFDSAREIVSKAQEANMREDEDINTNLAHIYLLQVILTSVLIAVISIVAKASLLHHFSPPLLFSTSLLHHFSSPLLFSTTSILVFIEN